MDQAEGMLNQDIAPVEAAPTQEGVVTQSKVNELIGKAKHAAYEKGKREALEGIQPAQQAPSMGGIPQITEDHVRQMIADEAHKQTQMQAAHSLLNNFAQQIGAGKGKYSDFDETIANLGNLQNIPHVVELATETGIAGDVMYELGRNPGKVASLTTLAYIDPQLAKAEMRKLADSIKKNEEAKEAPSVKEPLSQVRPSTVGTDNGSNAVRDLRRKAWARG